MKKYDLVYNELLKGVLEEGKERFSQLELSREVKTSISNVHHSLAPLRRMGAVRIGRRSLVVADPMKILYFWASKRRFSSDIIYSTRAGGSVTEIEKNMPSNAVFAAFSAYKYRFGEIPADYSEVYVYADDVEEIRKRFPKNRNTPNLLVLKNGVKEMTIANIFVDIWNIGTWYSKEFIKSLEEKIDGILAERSY